MSVLPTLFPSVDISSESICKLLSGYKFNFNDERALQDGIETVLVTGNFEFKRELHISKKDRPDFVLANGIAIEIKVQGTQSQFLRQASRYLLDQQISELILIGTPYWINNIPPSLHGKPISKLRLLRSMF